MDSSEYMQHLLLPLAFDTSQLVDEDIARTRPASVLVLDTALPSNRE
jgi:hypothetical protein